MPAKNAKKIFIPSNYYHIYNRGAHKAVIFHRHHDYATFMSLMKRYFENKSKIPGYDDSVIDTNPSKFSMSNSVELIAFCLMPNHFHFLLFIKEKKAVSRLMRSICGSYTTYYNQKYDHSGTLYQGRYKATHIDSAEGLLSTIQYIHENPVEITDNIENYEWSSYIDYKYKRNLRWLKKIGSDLTTERTRFRGLS